MLPPNLPPPGMQPFGPATPPGMCSARSPLMGPQPYEPPRETVIPGYGNSHFSHVRDQGWHVTTEVPGLRQGTRIADHFDIR